MVIQIRKAVKHDAKLRLALYGPSGSGKTMTSLILARELAGEKRVIVIDTERGSASKYADAFPGFDYDVIDLDNYHPNSYIEAIRTVVRTGEYDVLVLDSISHEWEGRGGALELAGKDFTKWSNVTPLHNAFVDTMLRADIHIIATMRAKEEYTMVKEDGKKAEVRKMGMEPIQRKGIQYEFDIAGLLEIDNTLIIEKTRCQALTGRTFQLPGKEVADILKEWLHGEPNALQSVSGNGTPNHISSASETVSRPPESQHDAAKKPRKEVVDAYQNGKKLNLWQNESGFYAAASAVSGLAVSASNVNELSNKSLLELLQPPVMDETAA